MKTYTKSEHPDDRDFQYLFGIAQGTCHSRMLLFKAAPLLYFCYLIRSPFIPALNRM